MPGTSDLQSEEDMLDGLQLRGRSFDVSADHSRSPSTDDGSFYHPDNNNVSEDDDENVKSMSFETIVVSSYYLLKFN